MASTNSDASIAEMTVAATTSQGAWAAVSVSSWRRWLPRAASADRLVNVSDIGLQGSHGGICGPWVVEFTARQFAQQFVESCRIGLGTFEHVVQHRHLRGLCQGAAASNGLHDESQQQEQPRSNA